MPEIDDDKYQALLRSEKILAELLNSPKTASDQQKLLKTLHPDYITDRDKAEPFVKEAKEAAEKVLKDHLKETKEQELDRRFKEDLASYAQSPTNPNGFTEEGIEKIKALMRERTIPDVHAAVALWEKQNPPKVEAPSGYNPAGWNFARADKDDKDRRLLFEDPDAWSDIEAGKVFEDVRKGAL